MAQMQIDLDKLPAAQMLNWEQCCAVLGISKSTFYNLVNLGQLKAERHGARKGIRVQVADLRSYKEQAVVEA